MSPLPIDTLKDMIGYYRRGGWYEVALRFSARGLLSDRLFLMNETQILELAQLSITVRDQILRDYSCAQADETSIEALLACSPEASRAVLRDSFQLFFAENARCYVVRRKDCVVGYVWLFSRQYVLTFDNYRSRNLTVALDDRTVFIGNAMIEENYHHKGLFQFLIRHAVGQLPSDTRVYSAADRTDDRSLSSHYRVGFVRHRSILCVTWLGTTRFFRRDREGEPWSSQSATEHVILTSSRSHSHWKSLG